MAVRPRPVRLDGLVQRDIVGIACTKTEGYAWSGAHAMVNSRTRPLYAGGDVETTRVLCDLLQQLSVAPPPRPRANSSPGREWVMSTPLDGSTARRLHSPLHSSPLRNESTTLDGPEPPRDPVLGAAADDVFAEASPADGVSHDAAVHGGPLSPDRVRLPLSGTTDAPSPVTPPLSVGIASSVDGLALGDVATDDARAHASLLGILAVQFESAAPYDVHAVASVAALGAVKARVLAWAGRVPPSARDGGALLDRAIASRKALFAGWNAVQPSYDDRLAVCLSCDLNE